MWEDTSFLYLQFNCVMHSNKCPCTRCTYDVAYVWTTLGRVATIVLSNVILICFRYFSITLLITLRYCECDNYVRNSVTRDKVWDNITMLFFHICNTNVLRLSWSIKLIPLSYLTTRFSTNVSRWVSLVEQNLLSFTWHLSWPF